MKTKKQRNHYATWAVPLRRLFVAALAITIFVSTGVEAKAFASRSWIGQNRDSYTGIGNWADTDGQTTTDIPSDTTGMTFITNGTTAVVEAGSTPPEIRTIEIMTLDDSYNRSGLILNDNLTVSLMTVVGGHETNPLYGNGHIAINNGVTLGYGGCIGVGVGANGRMELNNSSVRAIANANLDTFLADSGVTPGVVAFGNESARLLTDALNTINSSNGGTDPQPVPDLGKRGESLLLVSGHSTIEASAVHFSGNSKTYLGLSQDDEGSLLVGSATLSIDVASGQGQTAGNVYFYDGAAILLAPGSSIVLGEGMTLDLTNVSAATSEIDPDTQLPATGISLGLVNFSDGAYELIHATDIVFGTGFGADNFNDLFSLMFATTDESGGVSPSDGEGYLYMQNGSLWLNVGTAAVPEPATYAALAGLALFVYALVRRRS